jgi:hypothetical protein
MVKAAFVTDSLQDATECSPDRVSKTAWPADVRLHAGRLSCRPNGTHEPVRNGLLVANRAGKERANWG